MRLSRSRLEVGIVVSADSVDDGGRLSIPKGKVLASQVRDAGEDEDAPLPEAVAHHHPPRRAGQHPGVASFIPVADIVVQATDIGSNGEQRVPALEEKAWDDLGLEAAELSELADEVDAAFEAVEFAMIGEAPEDTEGEPPVLESGMDHRAGAA